MKRIVMFLALSFGVTVFAFEARACSCLPPPTVLDEFTRSDVVITARYDGMDEGTRVIEGTAYPAEYARLVVEKVYKGGLSIGQTIRVRSGGGGDCTYDFPSNELGQQFLVFTRRVVPDGSVVKDAVVLPVYGYSICSRSRRLDRAKRDLAFLDNLKTRANQTRLSGGIEIRGETTTSIANIEVIITGGGRERRVRTNDDGFFEVWDLPAGQYSIEIAAPAGWRFTAFAVQPSGSDGYLSLNLGPNGNAVSAKKKSVQVQLGDKKHTEIKAYMSIDNQIGGKVTGPDGEPMKGVCVSAYWLNPTTDTFAIPTVCSRENGEFLISDLPPGNYRLEINSRGEISAEQPFRTFYYPNATRKGDAMTISIGEGTQIQDLVVKIENLMPLITISGRLTYGDGRPFPDESVTFIPDDDSRYGRVDVKTDKDGRFDFKVAEGAKGWIKAEVNLFELRFSECPAARKLRGTKQGREADFTASVKINGEAQDLVLKLPIPYCKPVD